MQYFPFCCLHQRGGLKDKQEKCGRRTHKCANKCTNRGQSGPQTDTPVCETLHFALFNKLRVNRPGSTKMLGALIGLLAFGLLALGIAVVLLKSCFISLLNFFSPRGVQFGSTILYTPWTISISIKTIVFVQASQHAPMGRHLCLSRYQCPV